MNNKAKIKLYNIKNTLTFLENNENINDDILYKSIENIKEDCMEILSLFSKPAEDKFIMH